jgi:hypothetical protein
MSGREHRGAIYQKKGPDEVSWYRPHLERSLAFIEHAGLARDAPGLARTTTAPVAGAADAAWALATADQRMTGLVAGCGT